MPSRALYLDGVEPLEIMSRKKARARGLKHYYTGKICKNGHKDIRYTGNGKCRFCNGNYSKNYQKQSRKLDPRKNKSSLLKWKYGITLDDFEAMCMDQDGKCLVCKKQTKLVVDHDHNTKKVRGLLCKKCNVAIGLFDDNVSFLMGAIKYLKVI